MIDEKVILALISLLGVVISVIISFFVNRYQNRIAIKKIHSEFSGKLYSKRLDAYLEIYELISGFCKIIGMKEISYEELNDFHERYLFKDSKFGLLFSSSTVEASHDLRMEIRKMLIDHNQGEVINKDVMGSLKIKYLAPIELSLKYELGVFGYERPLALEDRKLAKAYSETWPKEKRENTKR